MTAPILQLPVKVLRSATAGRRPGDGTFRALNDGELFVNTQDRVACMLDASGTLFAFPIDPNVLATQAFVTGNFGTARPSVAGTAATGSAITAARSDHVHPTDTSRAKAGANTDITSLALNNLSCSGAGTFGNTLSSVGVVLTNLGSDGVFQSRLQCPGSSIGTTVAAAQPVAGPSVTLASVANLAVGMYAFGSNVPFPCKIAAIDAGKSAVTLSVATSAALAANATMSFSIVGYDMGFRYDGAGFYLMRTQKGVGNLWDGARPLIYDANVNTLLLAGDGGPTTYGGKINLAPGSGGGVSVVNGSSTTRLYDDANGHLESTATLWLNQATSAPVNIGYGGGITQIGAGLNVSGSATVYGGTISVNNGSSLILNAPANGNGMQMMTQMTGSMRWLFRPGNGASESGSNAGSDFDMHSYADDGSYIGRVFSVGRASRNAYFDNRPSWAGVTPWDTGNFNPASKASCDSMTVVGYNNGSNTRPYFNGGAGYRDLVYSNDGNARAIGNGVWGQGKMIYHYQPDNNEITYAPRTTGSNFISLRWNGSSACWQTDGSEWALQFSSDSRLKHIDGDVTAEDATSKLGALRPIAFEYDNDKIDLMTPLDGKRYGFIAQDLERLIPSLITEGPAHEDGNIYKMLSGDAAVQLCALLVKSNQDIRARLEAMEKKFNG